MGVLSKLGFGLVAGATGLALWQGYHLQTAQAESATPSVSSIKLAEQLAPRSDQVKQLHSGTLEAPFDVLIIGGGATGTGCALDACTRCCSRLPKLSDGPYSFMQTSSLQSLLSHSVILGDFVVMAIGKARL